MQVQKERKKNIIVKRRLRNRYKSVNRRNKRLEKKLNMMKKKVEILREKCATIKEDVLKESISNLPKKQQTAVKACFEASKLKNIRSMRYTTDWIYECILLRIKSKKLYRQLRKDKILILPSPETLAKYLRHIKSTYGFQAYIFEGLKKKTAFMAPEIRRGKKIKLN
ncbi:uncharacterized protein LOC127285415 [Leptopilina boulardi]|uniref:uncharacterized protein LOC127285415 n=1 Tax=Leptopilina boulardi TaxID=63433 RepID=UPI0021F52BD3|nr:uncharacterized protein LOC127285415 [Leptopilina boulardi]